MSGGYGFKRRTAERLLRMSQQVAGGGKDVPDYHQAIETLRIAKAPSGGIPALTETNGELRPGSATCTLMYRDGVKLVPFMNRDGNEVEVEVWNLVESVVGNNRNNLVAIDQDIFGTFWTIAADCSDTG